MEQLHTLFEWCLINNFRPTFDYEKDEFLGDDYMTREISLSEFKEFINEGKYEEGKKPLKPFKHLERRMYRLVPYNISDIQKGIQTDHAKDDYYNKYFNDEDCILYRRHWHTTIVLNGGTSNEGHMVKHGFREFMYVGTMQKHLEELKVNDVKVGVFYEPDLNSMLTSINFLVDERVWNKELYPDYAPLELKEDATPEEMSEWSVKNNLAYENWVYELGGQKNLFLRMFLSDKKLA